MCAVVRPRLLCVQWVSCLSDIPCKATCERKENEIQPVQLSSRLLRDIPRPRKGGTGQGDEG